MKAYSSEEREAMKVIISKLERLSDEQFVKFFRHFLSMKEYNYPDTSLLEDRYNAILVLLSDIDHQDILDAINKSLEMT